MLARRASFAALLGAVLQSSWPALFKVKLFQVFQVPNERASEREL